MKIGAERNKLILLAVVSVIAAYTVYSQLFSDLPRPRTPRPSPAAAPAKATNRSEQTRSTSSRPVGRGGNFRPRFGRGADDEPLDPMVVDPTIRIDLWAAVKAVEFEGVERDLFRFGERRKNVITPPDPDKVAEAQKRLQESQRARRAKAAAGKPARKAGRKAPPISFRYYGFANEPGKSRKRAFLLDGEDILIGGEGDVFKKRYKIIRIGLHSIVVEDLNFNDQQTLNLIEGPA